MDTEPTYEFQKGVGWVPTVEESKSCIREGEDGRQYKVTVIKRQPKLTERGSHYPDPLMQDWWSEWENGKGQKVPAGFGWGLYTETNVDYTVITELIP